MYSFSKRRGRNPQPFGSPRFLGRSATAIVCGTAIALLAASCSSGSGATGAATGFSSQFDPGLTKAAADAALKATGGKKDLGGKVSFVWQTSGAENTLLTNLFKTFTDATGIAVDVQSDPGMQTNLQAKVQAGSPPDVFIDSSSGDVSEYKSKLVPLDTFLDMDQFKKDFAPQEIAAASRDGHVYGVPGNVNAMSVWYDPKTYTGPTTGVTMDKLTAWAKDQVAQHKVAPFCGALSSGAFTANNASQFIDEIFAKQFGASALTDIATGKTPYNSPQMKAAWQSYLNLYQGGLEYGGATYSLSQPITSGTTNLLSNPQRCQVLPWGPYTESFINTAQPSLKPGTDYDFFNLASADASSGSVFQETGGWFTYAFNNTPQVQAFIKFFASKEFQTLVASTGHWLMANKNVSTDAYPSPLIQKLAKERNSSTIVVGPFGILPPTIRLVVFSNLVTAIKDPSKLDASLNAIDAAYATYRASHV